MHNKMMLKYGLILRVFLEINHISYYHSLDSYNYTFSSSRHFLFLLTVKSEGEDKGRGRDRSH